MFTLKASDDVSLALLEVRHADRLYQLITESREHLREWLTFAEATTKVEHTRTFIEGSLKRFASNDGMSTGIWYKDTLVGTIGLLYVDWTNRKTEIGYWIGKDYQGRGIMTQACRALVGYAFSELKLNRVEIRAGVMNRKSRAIPERLGFVQEGIIRQSIRLYDRYSDSAVYGMLAEEWDSRGN